MRKQEIIIIISLIIITGILTFGFIALDNNKKCDTVIEFVDGTSVTCKHNQSFNNGMTHYRDCNNKRVEVPTVRIKSIK